jgi:hypothetical protein
MGHKSRLAAELFFTALLQQHGELVTGGGVFTVR